jgi:AraC-like DNA-binding protein
LFDEKKHYWCPVCGSLKIQKWGRQNNKQRYHCTDCFHNFTVHNKAVSASNQFIWFRKWVMERQVYRYLVRDSGMSQSSLQRLFNRYLSSPPENVIKSKSKVHLLIDGTYFSNGLCLILYYDNTLQYVQLYRTTNKEQYKEIKEDLQHLQKMGVAVYSVTCDGHKSILKSVKKVYPNAVIQRCVVHVKRQAGSWLGKFPTLQLSRQLLQIVNAVTKINTLDEAHQWMADFHHWYVQNEAFINEQSLKEQTGKIWYTHKKLRAACNHLILAIPHLFCYINDPEIPKTTNELEGYFMHLKEKLTLHRGLRFEKKKNFIKWYLHLKNQHPK